ncbi:putative lipoprotein [Labilithrix luteola]|uniref:Putative lipoprotein n=1 Tax=Labilithrix luteola TaxID=1391654 RepID=A0A0K1QA49_9BACT|nr:hypothetical protein [Labilithrix luteola]AKV02547.1 putative lipoprotein [Labilithrix luteola]
MIMRRIGSAALLLVGACAFVACGGGSKGAVQTATAPGGSKDPSKWPADDRSMCDFRNKPELEVSETAGPGAIKPNVRRVYKAFGEGADYHHKSLVCREIDTNLDGIKDVVRTFNQKGEALHEEADTDYDGRIDVWAKFVDGRIAEEDVDTNHDGRPDVWKFFVDGQLQRIRRDRNGDGKPDVWEIYSKGRLERMGIDETFDGHVDRWDRDEQLKREADLAEKNAREQMEAASNDGGAPGSAAGAGAAAAGAANATNGASAAGASSNPDAGAPKNATTNAAAPKKK